MPLAKPEGEDLRKIHAEINQIVNQRIILTTLSITTFGVVTAWLIPKNAPSPHVPVGTFIFLGCLMLLAILCLIFLWNYSLTMMLRIYSTYLLETKASTWEADWKKYREKPYLGYTKVHTLVFALLGAITCALPYVLAQAYDLTLEPHIWLWVLRWATVAYEVTILIIGLGAFSNERRARKRWKELNV